MRSKGHQIFTRAHSAVYCVKGQLFLHGHRAAASYELIRPVPWPSIEKLTNSLGFFLPVFIRAELVLWNRNVVRASMKRETKGVDYAAEVKACVKKKKEREIARAVLLMRLNREVERL